MSTIQTDLAPHNINSSRIATDSVTLTWHKLSVRTVKHHNFKSRLLRKPQEKQKLILKNISGYVKPKEVVALMGSSGAGKSTLLNVITQRNLEGLRVEGAVLINKLPAAKLLRNISAFVQQDDLFIGNLTVKEHLSFQALLRLPRQQTYKYKMQRVTDVMREVGLLRCQDVLIGNPGGTKGISGGEKKRLSFATEILNNPSLMICDEPTSGLDSYMAQNVVLTLKNLAMEGRTILCTIHQPPSNVFALFDRIILLTEGRVAYFGSTNATLQYFANHGLVCPNNYNPADFFIQVLAIVPGKETECRKKAQIMCDDFEHNQEFKSLENYTFFDANPQVAISPLKHKGAGWFTQVYVLTVRSFVNVARERLLTRVRVAQTILTALLISLVFFQQPVDNRGVANRTGAAYMIIINNSLQISFVVMMIFCSEYSLFLREYWNGTYRVDTYFLGKTTAELPITIFIPVLMVSIAYYLIGFHADVGKFFFFMFVITMVANIGGSFGYMVSSLSNSVVVALPLAPALMLPLMLLGGFFINDSTIPDFLQWLKYISWYYYANELIAISQWQDCDYIPCVSNRTFCPKNGEEVLLALNFKASNFYRDIVALFLLFIGYRILAFFFLYLRSRKRK